MHQNRKCKNRASNCIKIENAKTGPEIASEWKMQKQEQELQQGRNIVAESYVKLEHVTKIYRMGEVEIRAVDGIDFEINKGEFVVIVGPIGAGKTTSSAAWTRRAPEK